MTEFKSSAEMFNAGYCVQQYTSNPNEGDLWRFKDEIYETPKNSVTAAINASPPVYVALLSDVVAAKVNHG
jgi:hypothetical protein